jgi:hypothetical protein
MREACERRTVIDNYELLCRTAHRKGWKVLLHSDHFGGKVGGEDLTSRVTCMEVQAGGEMIARAVLLPADELDGIAYAVLVRLKSAGLLAA